MIILLVVIGVLILCLGFIITYYGGFEKIEIKTSDAGGEVLLFDPMKGDYRQSGKVMDAVYNRLLNDHGISTTKGFGIYYDNPQKVAKSELRSEIGCILEPEDAGKLPALETSFSIRQLQQQGVVSTSFPYRGKLSILFSIFKVYPALASYASENNLDPDTPVMEIYDIPAKKILYRKFLQSEPK